MAHKRWPVCFEKFKGLPVRQMPHTSTDPVFQVIRIPAVFQHLLIIIRFQESRMALAELIDHVFAGNAEICKYDNGYRISSHDKTMRIAGIMKFRERRYGKITNRNRLMLLKGNGKVLLKL